MSPIETEIVKFVSGFNHWGFPYFVIGVMFGMWIGVIVATRPHIERRTQSGMGAVDPFLVKMDAVAEEYAEQFGPVIMKFWQATRWGKTYKVQMDELRRLNEGCAI